MSRPPRRARNDLDDRENTQLGDLWGSGGGRWGPAGAVPVGTAAAAVFTSGGGWPTRGGVLHDWHAGIVHRGFACEAQGEALKLGWGWLWCTGGRVSPRWEVPAALGGGSQRGPGSAMRRRAGTEAVLKRQAGRRWRGKRTRQKDVHLSVEGPGASRKTQPAGHGSPACAGEGAGCGRGSSCSAPVLGALPGAKTSARRCAAGPPCCCGRKGNGLARVEAAGEPARTLAWIWGTGVGVGSRAAAGSWRMQRPASARSAALHRSTRLNGDHSGRIHRRQ